MKELSRKTLVLLIAFALQLTVTSAAWADSFPAGGATASVEGENIEIGWEAWTEPNGKDDIAIGNLSKAGWNRGTAVGYFAWSAGLCGAAFGAYSCAFGAQSAAIGSNAAAEGYHGVAVGFFAEAKGKNSTAVGGSADEAGLEGTQALGNDSSAFGTGALAAGASSTASGAFSTARGVGSAACGAGSIAYNDGSIAIGQDAVSGRESGKSAGWTVDDPDGGLVVGDIADVDNSIAIGAGAAATNSFSTALALLPLLRTA